MALYSLGNELQRPLWAISEDVLQLFLPISACQNRCKEVAKRVCVAILAVPVLFVLFLPIAALGALLKGISKWFDPSSFEGQMGKTAGKVNTLLSFNVCMFPGGLPFFIGGVSPAKERMDRLCHLIKQKDPDLVALYEVMEPNAKELMQRLKKRYELFLYGAGKPVFAVDSGLFIASKKQPLKVNFQLFSKQEGIVRGFFILEFSDKVCVFTHLSSGTEAAEIRKGQLEEIFYYLESQHPNQKILFCGDLNLESSKESGFNLLNSKFTVAELEATYTNAIDLLRFQKSEKPISYLCDYVATRGLSVNIQVLQTNQEGLGSLSDHKALLVQELQ